MTQMSIYAAMNSHFANNCHAVVVSNLHTLQESADRPSKRRCLASPHTLHSNQDVYVTASQNGTSRQYQRQNEISTFRPTDAHGLTPGAPLSVSPLGGLITSRRPSSAPSPFSFFSTTANRLRIQDERSDAIPHFAGAPAWAKPLMFAEFQVPAPQHSFLPSSQPLTPPGSTRRRATRRPTSSPSSPASPTSSPAPSATPGSPAWSRSARRCASPRTACTTAPATPSPSCSASTRKPR